MKRLFLLLAIFFASCSIDTVASEDFRNPITSTYNVTTSSITIDGVVYNLTPILGTEYTHPMDYSHLYPNNPYILDNGVTNNSECGMYHMRFLTHNGRELRWQFRSKEDDFNTVYDYAGECITNRMSWFLLILDGTPMCSDRSVGHTISSTLVNDVYRVNGSLINRNGTSSDLNIHMYDFMYPMK